MRRLIAENAGLFSILCENRGTQTTHFLYEHHTVRAPPAVAKTPLRRGTSDRPHAKASW